MVRGTFPFPMFSQSAHSAFPTRGTLAKLRFFKLNHCEISSFFNAHISCNIRHVSGNFTIASSLLPW